MGYPPNYYYGQMTPMPDQEPNHGVTRADVVLCCVKLQAGDLVELRFQMNHSALSRGSMTGYFLGISTDGSIVFNDLRVMNGPVIVSRDRIIDVKVISSISEVDG